MPKTAQLSSNERKGNFQVLSHRKSKARVCDIMLYMEYIFHHLDDQNVFLRYIWSKFSVPENDSEMGILC